MIDLNEIADGCVRISQMRIKNGSRVDQNVLKHCAGEVAEAINSKTYLDLVNTYEYLQCVEDRDFIRASFAEELADIIICVLISSSENGIDIEAAIKKKFSINEKRALKIGDKL